jgi:hypothetical protein
MSKWKWYTEMGSSERRYAHAECIERWNGCMHAGTDADYDCGDPACGLSSKCDDAAMHAAHDARVAAREWADAMVPAHPGL